MSTSPRPWKVVVGHNHVRNEDYRKIVDANGVDVFIVQYPSQTAGSYVTAAGHDLELIVDAVNARAAAAGETEPTSKLAQEGMVVAEQLAGYGDSFGAEVVKRLAILAETVLIPHRSGLDHRRSDYADAAAYAMHSSLGHTFSILDLKCTRCGLNERDMMLNPQPCRPDWGPSPLQPVFEATRRVEPAADVEQRFNLPPGTLTKKHPRTP